MADTGANAQGIQDANVSNLAQTVGAIVAEALLPLKLQLQEVAQLKTDLYKLKTEWDEASRDIRDTDEQLRQERLAKEEAQRALVAAEVARAERAQAEKDQRGARRPQAPY